MALFPGFADPAGDRSWRATATIRLYADSALAVTPAAGTGGTTSIAPGRRAAVRFQLPPDPWPMPPGFAPLGVILARVGEQVWTRESGFAERSAR